jgi:signal transduction histidine kinase
MLFYNLAENALKACSDGGHVVLSCHGNTATVKDNGKGMTAEQMARVTEPFYRTDKSRSRADGGAGLGLALCKRIADAHGAEMKFSSRLGEGTEVSLTFTTRQ